MSAQTWNYEFMLPDESYFVSDIQGHFNYVIRNHKTMTDNP